MAGVTRRPGLGIVGGTVVLLFALYFFVPLMSLVVASMWQGGNRYDFSAFGNVFREENFVSAFKLSLMLAVETIVVTLAVVFPAVFWVNLRAPHLRGFFNVLSVVAFIVPPIVLVSGIAGLYRGPEWFVGTPHFLVAGYTILAIPYTYRTLDNGMRALNLQTLSEAAQSCGAGWGTLIRRIILPNVRGAVLGAVLLILTLALGEFTFANVLLYQTLPVYMSYIATTKANESSALAIMALLFTWLAMYVLLNVESRAARKT